MNFLATRPIARLSGTVSKQSFVHRSQDRFDGVLDPIRRSAKDLARLKAYRRYTFDPVAIVKTYFLVSDSATIGVGLLCIPSEFGTLAGS